MITLTKVSDSVTPAIRSIINAISTNGRRQLLHEAGRLFLEMTRKNFGTNGEYRTSPWAPLSRPYAKKVGSPTATLLRSGKLMNSIRVGYATNNSISIFTKDEKAAALIFGYKPRNLPGRQVFPIQTQGPSMTRLNYKAEKDMFVSLSKRLNTLSNGQLPFQSNSGRRMSYEFGSPTNL